MKFSGLDAAATAMMVLDSSRIIRYANPSAENFFNTSTKNLLDKVIDCIFISPNIINEIISLASENDCTFKSLDQTSNILSLKLDDNEVLDFSTMASPTNILGTPGFLLEFNSVNRQLQKIQREEQMLNQARGNHELIRNLAHEIKNPLGGLRGAAQLLASDNRNRDTKKFTDIIISEADRLHKLLDRLLIPAKLPTIQQFNVHEAIRQVTDLTQAEFPKTIEYKENFDVSLPNVIADKEQIIQAILNVVRNASQAIKDTGKITISTEVIRQVTLLKKLHPLAVKISVRDNGPGIPEEIKGKIFSPLISGRKNGSGLGLFLAQKLINQNQGTVVMQSKPGDTVFSIVLPITFKRI